MGGPYAGSITLDAGADSSTTIVGMPAGAVCNVCETAVAPSPAGCQWNLAATTYPANPVLIAANAVSSLTIANLLTRPNQLDPPLASKTVNAVDAQTLHWQMVEINAGNAVPLAIELRDPLPAGLSWVASSISCVAHGSTTVAACSIVGNQIVVDASLGSDAGATAATAQNALTIDVQTIFTSRAATVINVAQTYYDDDNDGNPDAGPSAASATYQFSAPQQPTLPVPVPVDARWLLLAIGFGLLTVGVSSLRRRKPSERTTQASRS